MSRREWAFACTNHDPFLVSDYTDSEDNLCALLAAAPKLLDVDDRFWPDDYISPLCWLRLHRACTVEIIDTEPSPPAVPNPAYSAEDVDAQVRDLTVRTDEYGHHHIGCPLCGRVVSGPQYAVQAKGPDRTPCLATLPCGHRIEVTGDERAGFTRVVP